MAPRFFRERLFIHKAFQIPDTFLVSGLYELIRTFLIEILILLGGKN
jgi:hypothetical protein